MGRKARYIQLRNPKSGNWVKIDRKLGIILGYRDKPWKNIKVIEKQ